MRSRVAISLILLLVVPLSGCTTTTRVERDSLDFPVLSSVNGVSNATGGNIDIIGEGVNVTADTFNKTVKIGFQGGVRTPGLVQACRGLCEDLGLPDGMVIAEGSLISLNNLTLNAAGPDHDSGVFFYDDGEINGQYIRWDDANTRFEVSRDGEFLGNLTARHHVGTVTTIVLGGVQAGATAEIATAALEGNEASIFLRGSAKLTNGTARIEFPAVFKVLVSGNVTAQVTATSRGDGLFVSERARDHIVVGTLSGAASEQTFDYFVQATRAASEDFQTVR